MKKETNTKVNATAKVEAPKAEAKKEEAVKTEIATKKTEAKKTEDKKTEDKKTEAKKTTTAKKTATKKTATKKAEAKDTVESHVFIQTNYSEIVVDDVINKALEAYKAEGSKTKVKNVNVYIKPEENAAYYVVNDKIAGRVDIF